MTRQREKVLVIRNPTPYKYDIEPSPTRRSEVIF